MSARLAPLMASARQDWQTPEHVLDLVRACGDTDRIDLDPATADENPTGAGLFYTTSTDGLDPANPWVVPNGGVCYLNPPFDGVRSWVARWVAEAATDPLAHYLMLTPARPDTRWWAELVAGATMVAFLRGRLRFRGAPASAPFPTAVTYAGPRPDRFVRALCPSAWVVRA